MSGRGEKNDLGSQDQLGRCGTTSGKPLKSCAVQIGELNGRCSAHEPFKHIRTDNASYFSNAALGNLGEIVGGGTPRSDNPAYFSDKDGIPWLTPADLNSFTQKRVYRGRRFITELGLRESSARLLPEGTVLFSSRAPIGYVAIAGRDLATNQGFKSCIPFIRETNEYIFYYLMSAARRIDSEASGTTFREVSGRLVSQIPVAVPPLAEQQRIVGKVDELMPLCDQLEAQQKEREARQAALARAAVARFTEDPTPPNLTLVFRNSYTISTDDLRKLILSLAVRGQLVPQDIDDESVDDLLRRNLEERRQHNLTNATDVHVAPTDCTLGYRIPPTWRWQPLGELLVFGPTNGISPKGVEYETPVRSLTLSATTSGRFKEEHFKFVDIPMPAESELWLREGDILVQRANTIDYVGVAAIYPGGSNEFIYPDLMMKMRVSTAFDVRYIVLAMSEEAARNFLRVRASGTSGSMPKINQATLRRLPIPIAPLAEQRRIAKKVDELLALIDAMESQLTRSRTIGLKLLDAVLAELTAVTPRESARVPARERSTESARRRSSSAR